MTRSKPCLTSVLCGLSLGIASAAIAGYTADITEVMEKAEPWPAQINVQRSDAVTREMYLKTAEEFFKVVQHNAGYWLKQPKPYPNMSFQTENGLWFAHMYQITGNEEYAQQAAKCIEHAYRLVTEPQTDEHTAATATSESTVWDLYWLDAWLKKSPAYTDQHRQYVRAIALRECPSFIPSPEYGVHNRTFGAAYTGQALLALVPDAPDADKWRAYADTIWNSFWAVRDTGESNDHYTALWIRRYLLDWIQVRGVAKEFWADPGVKKLMERFLYQAFPMGAFPHYSDSCGWNVTWGHWVWIFEECAAHYKDGRYKWAAHRIYDYGVNRIEVLSSWAYTGTEAGFSLLHAYTVADDTIPEKSREKEIVLLKRHKVALRTRQERERTNQYLDLFPEMAPDKLVFYSGSDRDGLSMMVDVVGDAWHSHARRPAILALADHQCVLLMSPGYMDRAAEDHDMAQVADYDGYPYDNTEFHIKSNNNVVLQATAVDLGPVGYGLAKIGNYQGYPATCDREIIFIKDVGVLVKDTLSFSADLRLRWGQLYRVRNLGPDYGFNWVNSYMGEWVPLRGLGKNAPVLTRWHNNPRDLLIYFLPDAQGTLEVVDESAADKTCPQPLRIQYTIRQNVKPDVPIGSTTLLLPHPPGPGKTLAEKVKVHLNEPACTLLEFVGPEGDTHLVLLNHSGTPVRVPGLITTDGQLAYARKKGNEVTAAGLFGGKQLSAYGKDAAGLVRPARADVVPEE